MAAAVPHIRLIGAVAVARESELVEVGRPRQRAVLTVLALRASQLVSRNALVRAVWGDPAPRSSLGNLHTYVSGLRQILELDSRKPDWLRTEEHGYRLRVPPENVDALEFDRLVAAATETFSAGDVADCLATLDAADALWRGSPLAGVAGPFVEHQRARLQRVRLAGRELRAEALLASGGSAHATVVCASLVQEFPLEERAARLLSLSLYRSGRLDDALAELTALRKRLHDELGVQPAPETAQLYQEMLSGDLDSGDTVEQTLRSQVSGGGPKAVDPSRHHGVVPAQLPHRLWSFVGRDRELVELTRTVACARQPVVICGYVGIGKTALALAFAHGARHEFPDGQLYLNLHGSDPAGPVSPAEALDFQLHAFGVRTQDLPDGLEAKVARLRSILNERQALLLFDDAADVSQLRPLLDASGHAAVLITSRRRLSGLGGVNRLTLTELESAAAMKVLQGERASQLPPWAEDVFESLVSLCGRVPLALQIAAKSMGRDFGVTHDVGTIRDLAEELVDEASRLTALSIDDESVSMSTGLEHTCCHTLSPDASALLARLSKQASDEFSVETLAGELDVPPSRLRAVMAELVEACLLRRVAGGTYHLPPLVRVFGANHISAGHGSNGPATTGRRSP